MPRHGDHRDDREFAEAGPPQVPLSRRHRRPGDLAADPALQHQDRPAGSDTDHGEPLAIGFLAIARMAVTIVPVRLPPGSFLARL